MFCGWTLLCPANSRIEQADPVGGAPAEIRVEEPLQERGGNRGGVRSDSCCLGQEIICAVM